MKSASRSLRVRVAQVVLHVRTPLYFNAYALMLSNTLSSALGVVYWAVAARLYSPSDVGVQSALISLMLFTTGISQLNLRVALTRLIPEAGSGARRLILASYAISAMTSVLVSLCVLLLLAVGIVSGQGWLGDAGAVAVFVLGSMAWSIFNLQDGVFAGIRRAGWIPLENALYGVAKLALLVLFGFAVTSNGILYSFVLPMGIVVVLANVLIFKRLMPEFDLRSRGRTLSMKLGRLVRFLSGDYLASLFALAYVSLLPILVVTRLGPSAGAVFYIVWIMVISLTLIPQSVSVSMTVETITLADWDPGAVRRALWHSLRITVPLVAVVLLGAPLILAIFGPVYASEGTDALRLFALGVVPYAVVAIGMATARIAGRTRDLIVIQAIVTVIILGGTYALIDRMGITGVAIGWLAGQTAVAAVLLATRLRFVLASGDPISGPR